MQLVFDRGLATEHGVNIDFYGEALFRGTMNATWSRTLTDNPSVPDLGTLRSRPDFVTVEVAVGSTTIPLQGEYNAVVDANATYNAATGIYTATVVLGRAED